MAILGACAEESKSHISCYNGVVIMWKAIVCVVFVRGRVMIAAEHHPASQCGASGRAWPIEASIWPAGSKEIIARHLAELRRYFAWRSKIDVTSLAISYSSASISAKESVTEASPKAAIFSFLSAEAPRETCAGSGRYSSWLSSWWYYIASALFFAWWNASYVLAFIKVIISWRYLR